MAENQYIYAVARIHSKEMSLLDSKCMEQLLSCKKYEDCARILADHGWDVEGKEISCILAAEREKTWALMNELVEDQTVFSVFLYENDFHNLKAAIKQVCTDHETKHIYKDNGTIPYQKIYEAVKTDGFALLPEYMQACGKEALHALLKGNDSQLCDVIIDKASLTTMYLTGKKQKSELLQEYVELKVAAADINIALRSCKMKKSLQFVKRALVSCSSLDIEKLAFAVLDGLEAICDYLSTTIYSDAIPQIKSSSSAFEKWCDDRMIRLIRPQKYHPFTVEPLAAYLLARENEMKCVRILLSGKLNHLSEESIRERLREMYV